MLAVVNVVAPVFAIVAIGYLAVRFRLYPAEGVKGLLSFVNNFVTPLLLFRAALTLDLAHFRFDLLVPFYSAAILVMVLGNIIARRLFGSRPGEAGVSGLVGSFSNLVLLGLPIATRAYGDDVLPVAYALIGTHAATLMTLGIIIIETSRSDGLPFFRAVGKTGQALARNPMLMGIALGFIANLAGLELPQIPSDIIAIMIPAIIPVALFGLGGALNSYTLRDNWQQALVLAGLKLIALPGLIWILLVPVLGVPQEFARYAVLFSAMPAGINVYIVATYYKRNMDLAANGVLLTTLISVVTISVWLAILQ